MKTSQLNIVKLIFVKERDSYICEKRDPQYLFKGINTSLTLKEKNRVFVSGNLYF